MLYALVALTALAAHLVTRWPPSHEIWQDPKGKD